MSSLRHHAIFEFCENFLDGSDVEFSHLASCIPIQLGPTMQNKLFTSSFQAKFLKIRFTKLQANFLYASKFSFSPV